MFSRLHRIKDWPHLARDAMYEVRNLALLVNSSPRQLQRYFAEHFHEKPKRWMDRQRMAAAQRLLQNGDAIKDVATELKFKHSQNFTRTYKRLNNGSPPSRRRCICETLSIVVTLSFHCMLDFVCAAVV